MTAWLLRLLLLGVALAWLRLLWRARRTPSFQVGPDQPLPAEPMPPVSVVIPARNEEDHIVECLETVLAQDHPDLQVLVLDDDSADATAARVSAMAHRGVRLLYGAGGPPPGWLGKPWALERAQEQATQPWLLFLDADVRLHPRAVSRALAWALSHRLEMLSGFGKLETRGFWERAMQPVIGGLIVAGNDLRHVNGPARSEVMANGQFILISREAYDQIGRHGAVKGEVVEDVALARAAKEAGVPYHCVFMRDLFSCRMYRGLAELWRGWRKNLFIGMGRSWATLAGVIATLTISGLLPYLVLLLGALGVVDTSWAAWGGGVVLSIHAARLGLDLRFGEGPIYGLAQPLAMVMVILLMLDSARITTRGGGTWKGRALDQSPSR